MAKTGKIRGVTAVHCVSESSDHYVFIYPGLLSYDKVAVLVRAEFPLDENGEPEWEDPDLVYREETAQFVFPADFWLSEQGSPASVPTTVVTGAHIKLMEDRGDLVRLYPGRLTHDEVQALVYAEFPEEVNPDIDEYDDEEQGVEVRDIEYLTVPATGGEISSDGSNDQVAALRSALRGLYDILPRGTCPSSEPDDCPVCIARALIKPLSGERVVVTGKVPGLTRVQAQEAVVRLGGESAGSVSKTTTLLVVGDGAGSKADKAEELGVRLMSADEFAKLAA